MAHRAWDDAEQSREAFRQRQMDAIGPRYSPWLHLALTTLPGVLVVAAAVWRVRDPSLLELLAIPLTFVFANLGEWHIHRNVLHRRWKAFPILYDLHTPVHHRVYRYTSMEVRSARELKLVLIPPVGVAALVVLNLPLALGIGWLVSANVGWLYLATAGVYVVGYELSHAIYHLPADSFLGRRALVRKLRELHALHHDPRLMQRHNFNVTVPLGDWLFGTLAPADRVAEARAALRES